MENCPWLERGGEATESCPWFGRQLRATYGNARQRKVAPCLDDTAAHCKPVLVDDDQSLGRGGDEDGLNQYMDTVTWKVLVVGLQEEVNHVVPGRCN